MACRISPSVADSISSRSLNTACLYWRLILGTSPMYLSLSVDPNPTVHAAIARVLQAELAMLFLLALQLLWRQRWSTSLPRFPPIGLGTCTTDDESRDYLKARCIAARARFSPRGSISPINETSFSVLFYPLDIYIYIYCNNSWQFE